MSKLYIYGVLVLHMMANTDSLCVCRTLLTRLILADKHAPRVPLQYLHWQLLKQLHDLQVAIAARDTLELTEWFIVGEDPIDAANRFHQILIYESARYGKNIAHLPDSWMI